MGGEVGFKLWVELGSSPQYTEMVQLAHRACVCTIGPWVAKVNRHVCAEGRHSCLINILFLKI